LVAWLRGGAGPVIQPKLESSAGFQVEPNVEQRITHAGGGQPLPETVRQSLEPRFGADFSGVRVHADATADQLNHSLQAQAFTTGQNIFFRRGAYAPGSQSGQRLLTHELTHVVQQTGAGQGSESAQRSVMPAKLTVGPAHDVYEQEAERVATQVTRGHTPESPVLKSGSKGPSPNVVQRRLLVQDGEVNLSLLLKLAPDMATRVIIANWAWSDTEHNFSSVEKLFEAINSARLKSKDVPALYSADNLEFLTQTPGRLPTLYFRSGIHSGRIRQQHGSGPAIIAETYKIDYFFADNTDKSNFAEAASRARRAKPKTTFQPTPDDPATYFNVKLEPMDGDYHCEVTYTGADTWTVQKVHPSEGRIVTDTSTYDDEKIKKIYQSAVGYTT
jgi:hypothetical protein